MSKLSTPLLIVLVIVTAVSIGGWRSYSVKYSTAMTESISTSNKLAEVTARLAEQGAANQTLRVQLDLQKSDLAEYTNKVGSLQVRIVHATKREGELEASIRDRDAELRAANQNTSRCTTTISSLESGAAALRGELEAVRAKLLESQAQSQAANDSLNAANSEIASLQRKLSDPAVLRAELENANRSSSVSGKSIKSAKLTLQSDGTVILANAQPPPQIPPSKTQSKPRPVFKEIPGIATP
jgi:chromosome segregation ATPase